MSFSKAIYASLVFSLTLSFQTFAGPDEPDAEILSLRQDFTLKNEQNGSYSVSITVRVNNDEGRGESQFVLYTDDFTSLESFSGVLTPSTGNTVKLKKSDLRTVALSEGLADDSYVTAYSPSCQPPYEVTYNYKVSYNKGILSFPAFVPVGSYGTSIKEAEYHLSVPSGTSIMYDSNIDVEKKQSGKTDEYVCRVSDVQHIRREHNMPSVTEMLPFCRWAPESFSFAGYKGSQSSWEDVGAWVYRLNEEVSEIPDALKTEAIKLTEGLDSDYDKVKAIYDYLRRTTRYVSIQLGIGGYRPSPAKDVLKAGFGDCKALSNYMKVMLKAVGIESNYVVLSTKTKRMSPEFHSVGASNHAMLCVPLPQMSDTLWVECTNPSYPLCYRHDAVAGSDVLVIGDGAGKVVKVPSYQVEGPTSIESFDIDLKEDGSASMACLRTLKADEIEPVIELSEASEKYIRSILTGSISSRVEKYSFIGQNTNYSEYDGPGFIPQTDIRYSVQTRSYARASKDRLFVPVTPTGKGLSMQRSERKYDFVIHGDYCMEETTVIVVPEGYDVESLPESVDLEGLGSHFSSTTKQSIREDGRIILTTVQTYSLSKGRFPASEYETHRSFVKAVNKSCSASAVLIKKQ